MSNYYILDTSSNLVKSNKTEWIRWIGKSNPYITHINGHIIKTVFTGIGECLWCTYITFPNGEIFQFGNTNLPILAINMHREACLLHGIKNNWLTDGF